MRLPHIDNPEKYVGLYIYDFKTHVSVGYTAREIRYLRESKEHRYGVAYQIYRVTENGGLELTGVRDERLTAYEALCFLRVDEDAARQDFDTLRRLAKRHPMPCAVELILAKVTGLALPNATALLYAAPSSNAISAWLGQTGFHGGDQVMGGSDVHTGLLAPDTVRVDSCHLPTTVDYKDRSADEVLNAVHQPLQR